MESLIEFWAIVVDVWNNAAFGTNLGRIVVAVGVLALFLVVRRLFARFIIAWLKRFVDDDRRYDRFLSPPDPRADTTIADWRNDSPSLRTPGEGRRHQRAGSRTARRPGDGWRHRITGGTSLGRPATNT